MKKILILSLFVFSSTSFAAVQPSPDITDAIAVASVLTMFGLGFIAGCK